MCTIERIKASELKSPDLLVAHQTGTLTCRRAAIPQKRDTAYKELRERPELSVTDSALSWSYTTEPTPHDSCWGP